jgi:hypothetical protein
MRYCTDEPVPETTGNRLGHERRDGRSDERQLVVAMVFSPFPEGSEGRGEPRLGGGLRREEQPFSPTRVCVDQFGAFDDLSEGGFL